MPRKVAAALAAVLAGALGGCGSACNTMWWTPEEGGMRVFGGVRADAQVLADAFSPNTKAGVGDRLGCATLATIDLPLSAVGDTLTLPVTLPAASNRRPDPGHAERPKKQADADDDE
jgi:uncharacterized protein YceK